MCVVSGWWVDVVEWGGLVAGSPGGLFRSNMAGATRQTWQMMQGGVKLQTRLAQGQARPSLVLQNGLARPARWRAGSGIKLSLGVPAVRSVADRHPQFPSAPTLASPIPVSHPIPPTPAPRTWLPTMPSTTQAPMGARQTSGSAEVRNQSV